MGFFCSGVLVVQLAVSEGRPERASFFIGLVGLATAVPVISLTLFAGAFADRVDLRRVMGATQLAFAALLMFFGVRTATGAVATWEVVAFAAGTATVTALEQPARQALLTRVVGPGGVVRAVGLWAGGYTIAQIVGPVIGGLLVGPFGIGPVLLVAAAGPLLMALSLAFLPPLRGAPGIPRSLLADAREGVLYVVATGALRWSALSSVVVSFLARPYTFLLPALAASVLGVGASELSWLVGAVGAGSVLGSALVAVLGTTRHRVLITYLSATGAGAALVAAGLVRTLAPALVVSFAFGSTAVVFGSLTVSTMQLAASEAFRARVSSWYALTMSGSIPVGQLVLGALASALGLPSVLTAAGLVLVAFAAYGVLRFRDAASGPGVYATTAARE
jgi:predicted MFS family arabinose efflux permease